MSRFVIKTIRESDLETLFREYQPNFTINKVKEIFNRTYQLCFNINNEINFTNVIHTCYDRQEKQYCAILNIGTYIVEDTISINVEFLFVEPNYRKKKFIELGNRKLSQYLLLDYVIGEIGIDAKRNFGIGWVALTPISKEVRELYTNYGFVSIKGSGNNKYEDWMIFNIPQE